MYGMFPPLLKLFFYSSLRILSQRGFALLRNAFRVKLGIKNNNISFDGVSDIIECEKTIYETLYSSEKGLQL